MKILFWDIETSLQPVAVFQLAHNDWIRPEALLDERYIICAAWKWGGEQKVNSVSVLDDPTRFKKDPHDDRHVVSVLRDLVLEADVLVHHKGDSFDRLFLNTRALSHGFQALPPVPSIDTYKVAKANFFLNSNSLNYLGKFLGLGEKIHVEHELWLRVLNGDKSAIAGMVRYNKQDVSLLERVYYKLQPYVTNHLNRELLGGKGCPRCGSQKIQSRGVHRAITRTYKRWQCQGCGGWFRTLKCEKGSSTQHRML